MGHGMATMTFSLSASMKPCLDSIPIYIERHAVTAPSPDTADLDTMIGCLCTDRTTWEHHGQSNHAPHAGR